MVAVGVWGAQLGAPALWVLPVVFPMVMALGGMMGLMGIKLPGIELCIALSAVALGFAVFREARPKLWIAARCWKLDCCHRPLDARLGDARARLSGKKSLPR